MHDLFYDNPGGGVEANEFIESAASRETFEETGYLYNLNP